MPVTAAGWLTLALSLITFAGVLIGWGKSIQKFNDMEARLIELARDLGKLDPDLGKVVEAQIAEHERFDLELRSISFTLWGPQKNNGMYTKVREFDRRIIAIEERNKIIDALAEERERGAAEAGRETRERNRRREDKLARGEGE